MNKGDLRCGPLADGARQVVTSERRPALSVLARKRTVLVVDDSEDNRIILQIMLERAGYAVYAAASGVEALALYGEHRPALCLLDLQMPGMDGLAVLAELRRRDHGARVIMVTAYGSIERAVEAMREGAIDFLPKPIDRDNLLDLVGRHASTADAPTAPQDVRRHPAHDEIVAVSPAMRGVMALATDAARAEAVVLISGESGVGKEAVARAIHGMSPRAASPFFAVNCAAISESLVESELFGHERGAFTGADRRKAGLLEQAGAGTLLLDEIGEIPLRVQTKLLRVIESREMIPVGGTRPVPVTARLIAATNADLRDLVQRKQFREDLFFRLNVIAVHIPPLRERREDILPTALFILDRLARAFGRDLPGFSRDAVDHMVAASWHGNVRELANAIERAAMVSRGSLITAGDFPDESSSSSPLPVRAEGAPLSCVTLDEVERTMLVQALDRAGHNLTRAARLLGVGRGALRYKLQKHAIPRRSVG